VPQRQPFKKEKTYVNLPKVATFKAGRNDRETSSDLHAKERGTQGKRYTVRFRGRLGKLTHGFSFLSLEHADTLSLMRMIT